MARDEAAVAAAQGAGQVAAQLPAPVTLLSSRPGVCWHTRSDAGGRNRPARGGPVTKIPSARCAPASPRPTPRSWPVCAGAVNLDQSVAAADKGLADQHRVEEAA
jgi:hypothetical protein